MSDATQEREEQRHRVAARIAKAAGFITSTGNWFMCQPETKERCLAVADWHLSESAAALAEARAQLDDTEGKLATAYRTLVEREEQHDREVTRGPDGRSTTLRPEAGEGEG